MKYNLLKHNSCHSTNYRVTSHLNTTYFHIICVLKDQNTIIKDNQYNSQRQSSKAIKNLIFLHIIEVAFNPFLCTIHLNIYETHGGRVVDQNPPIEGLP